MALDFGPVLDIALVAAEDLSAYQYRFVTLDTSGNVKLLDSAVEVPFGVLQNDPILGQGATVRRLGASKLEANAALAVGTYIKAEFVSGTDNGKAQDATSNKEAICGIVIEASGAEDDLVCVALKMGAGVAGPKVDKTVVTTDATAGALTYTPAMLIGGMILRDPAGANRSDVCPLATAIIAAMVNPQIGDSFQFEIINTADAAETITVGTATGVTLVGTMTIAQNNCKRFLCIVTAAATVSIYSLGTATT